MTYIIDKITLLALIYFLFFRQEVTMQTILALLAAVIFSAVNSAVEKKWSVYLCLFLYIPLLLRFPQVGYIYPVLLYDSFLAEIPMSLVLSIPTLWVLRNVEFYQIVMLILLGLMALWLAKKSRSNIQMERMIKKIRDDSVEKSSYLAEKNRHLIEQQDSEIHVATLRERNRIAREIHDNVGHMLTRSILQMGALLTIHKEEPIHGQLISVKESLDVAMNNIRESVHDLHDESIDLKQVIEEVTEPLQSGFTCQVEYDISDDVGRAYKYALIGIVREAVANILKHSKNDRVDIVLREHPAMYQLVVWDYASKDAQGKTGSSTTGKSKKEKLQTEKNESGNGIGIQNMQDRVDSLKGHMTITRDMGYKILVVLPR